MNRVESKVEMFPDSKDNKICDFGVVIKEKVKKGSTVVPAIFYKDDFQKIKQVDFPFLMESGLIPSLGRSIFIEVLGFSPTALFTKETEVDLDQGVVLFSGVRFPDYTGVNFIPYTGANPVTIEVQGGNDKNKSVFFRFLQEQYTKKSKKINVRVSIDYKDKANCSFQISADCNILRIDFNTTGDTDGPMFFSYQVTLYSNRVICETWDGMEWEEAKQEKELPPLKTLDFVYNLQFSESPYPIF